MNLKKIFLSVFLIIVGFIILLVFSVFAQSFLTIILCILVIVLSQILVFKKFNMGIFIFILIILIFLFGILFLPLKCDVTAKGIFWKSCDCKGIKIWNNHMQGDSKCLGIKEKCYTYTEFESIDGREQIIFLDKKIEINCDDY